MSKNRTDRNVIRHVIGLSAANYHLLHIDEKLFDFR